MRLVARFLSVVTLLALVAPLSITSVFASTGGKELPEVKKQSDISALVPKSVQESGTLAVVMTTSSPPAHFATNDGMRGLDRDLATLIAEVVGLEPKIIGVPLDQIIPGLQAHRYNAVISQFRATKARGKVLDFIDYAQAGPGLGVPRGNPKGLTMNSLCGVAVGVQKGSSQALHLGPELSDACVGKGEEPLQVKTFSDQSTALLSMRSGRVDGVLLDSPIIAYAAKQTNRVELIGLYSANPVAVGVLKNSDLAKAIQQALQYLKRSGAYDQAFASWGMSKNGISKFAINNLQGD